MTADEAVPEQASVRVHLRTASGERPLAVEGPVVVLADGRLGLVPADPCRLDGPDGILTGAVVTVEDRSGRRECPARLVRSGPAYEEVRARLRADAGRLDRWRQRRDRPVLLVEVGPSVERGPVSATP